jgi:hypothetical protein
MSATDAVPRPEFQDLGCFYNAEIAPWLEAQEHRRLRARRLRLLVIGLGLPVVVGAFIYLMTAEDSPDDLWFFALFFVGICVIIAGNVPLWSLRDDVKRFVMEKLGGFFGFRFAPNPDFKEIRLFRDLFLVPHHHNANFEDGLEGAIKGVPFRMVDARLSERRGSGKDRSSATVFRGLLLSFAIPMANDEPVAVWRRALGRWSETENRRPVPLGEPGFDDGYVVHAADVAAARRLLDRDARRAFEALDRRAGVKDARLGVIDGRLLIALNTDADSFEVKKLNRPLADPGRVQAMVDQFAVLFDVVDDFELRPAEADRAIEG